MRVRARPRVPTVAVPPTVPPRAFALVSSEPELGELLSRHELSRHSAFQIRLAERHARARVARVTFEAGDVARFSALALTKVIERERPSLGRARRSLRRRARRRHPARTVREWRQRVAPNRTTSRPPRTNARMLGRSIARECALRDGSCAQFRPRASFARRGVAQRATMGSREVASIELVPAGDFTVDHLPESDRSRVPSDASTSIVRLPLEPGARVIVGRSKPANVVLPYRTVSARHAEICIGDGEDAGKIFVKDLGSKNGTGLNGRALRKGEPREIFAGDFLTFGDAHLGRYECVAVFRTRPKEERKAKMADEPKGASASLDKVWSVLMSRASAAGGDAVSTLSASTSVVKPSANQRASADAAAVVKETPLEPDTILERGATELAASTTEVTPASKQRTNEREIERILLTPVNWSGPVIELEAGRRIVLGTSKKRGEVDVILAHPGVDGSHAAVVLGLDGVFVEDLQSKTGTFVGGRQIKAGLQYAVSVGDEIMLGDSGCVFEMLCIGDDLEAAAADDTEVDDTALVSLPSPQADIIQGQDFELTAVNDGGSRIASPWGVLGNGLRGMGDNLGAAIFNSKINVNYSYKPNVTIGGSGKVAGLADLKAALLLALADTERGLRADKERRKKIEQLVRALEAKNPTRTPLKSPMMNGRWALQYTTQLSVVGQGKPGFMRPKGAIFQTLDIFTLQVFNEETFEPFPFVKFRTESTFDLSAKTDSRASVTPKDVRFAGIRIKAPPVTPGRAVRNIEMEASGAGSMAWQDTTFVDGEMRISRTQSGDFFIFVRDDENDGDSV